MILYMSVNSPYARLVRVLLREAGAEAAVREVATDPRDATSGFWGRNPVGRIPALELADGTVIAESDLICRHLDARLSGGRFHAPPEADARRLRLLGLARGMLDRAVNARMEKLRPGGPDHAAYIRAQLGGVERAADALNLAAPDSVAAPDIADLTLACAVEWIDFRHADLGLRASRPGLARWCAALAERPSFQATRPQ